MNLEELGVAPAWSLAVGEAGKISVIVAAIAFALAIAGYALAPRIAGGTRAASALFGLGVLSLVTSFGCLIALFVQNQFQFEYVFARADVHTELRYKVAGVWSGQQGSFMLWGVLAGLIGLWALPGVGPFRRGFGGVYAAFLGAISGILAYETPFNLLKEVQDGKHVHMPVTGNGMVPSLQNYWIVIHPPTIFLGFALLTVMFALAVAAMLQRDVRGWVPYARPWALFAVGVLGLGICMGGFWAYETLGWGGFWMWDPVENASFVPWLLLVGFVHGALVQTSRGRWHGANLWLAAAPFLAFLYGTFLTRSGALGDTSVHAFAQMERSALRILIGLMGTCILGFAGLYFWRGRALAREANRPVDVDTNPHREGLYAAGVLTLSLFALVIGLGMSWPFILASTGRTIEAIKEPAYHKVVTWFFVPIMLLMAIAPFVRWRGSDPAELRNRLVNFVSAAAGSLGAMLLVMRMPSWGLAGLGEKTMDMPFGFRMAAIPWIAFLLFICLFTIFANLWRLIETLKRSRTSAGAFLSHLGLATLVAGLIVSRGFERDEQTMIQPGRPGSALGYGIEFKDLVSKGQYDRDGKVIFALTSPEGQKFELRPGLFYNRQADGSDQGFVWPAIKQGPDHDVYMAIQPPLIFVWEGQGHWFKPGEKQTYQGITVEYQRLIVEGEPGTPSASFGAKLRVTIPDTDDPKVMQTFDVMPKFTLQSGPDMPFVGRDLRVAIMQMDAKDRSVQLQMMFSKPVYQVHLFTKPLTGLVWLGTGIMFVGGLMSAWARRRVPKDVSTPEAVLPPVPDAPPVPRDAPVPTP